MRDRRLPRWSSPIEPCPMKTREQWVVNQGKKSHHLLRPATLPFQIPFTMPSKNSTSKSSFYIYGPTRSKMLARGSDQFTDVNGFTWTTILGRVLIAIHIVRPIHLHPTWDSLYHKLVKLAFDLFVG